MPVDPLLSLLIGAFGASVVGLAGALLGAWLQSRREHSRWTRDKRFEAYAALFELDERRRDVEQRGADSPEAAEYLRELARVKALLRIFGSEQMRAAIEAHSIMRLVTVGSDWESRDPDTFGALVREYGDLDATRQAMTDIVRREVGTRRRTRVARERELRSSETLR